MSPRAACRLEAIGFTEVYDYVLGIADWKAAGLPVEGEALNTQLIADATRPDIPTARPDELLGTVFDRTTNAGWDETLVLDCNGIVIGRLRTTSWEHDRDTPVGSVMELGPTTVRPNMLLEPLVKRMEERGTNLVTVTTPQGTLIGVVLRTEAQRLLTGEPPQQIWINCNGCPGTWKTR
jgi:CBS domain-containing protein